MDYEEQLSAAKFRAERDQARQEVKELREELDAASKDAAERSKIIEAARWVRDHGGLAHVMDIINDFRAVVERIGVEWSESELHAIMGVLDSRLMPKGMEWPRYDTGEKVELGCQILTSKGGGEVCGIEFNECGICVLSTEGVNGEEQVILDIENGERVKRPAVLAADGEPLEVGQTVWDANGDELVIGALEDGGHTVTCRYVDVGDGIPVHGMWSPSDLTHQRPVLDADGVPINVGDRVWNIAGGGPYEITRVNAENAEFTYNDNCGPMDWGANPKELTHKGPHTKPEPQDSWERIEEDAAMQPYAYCVGNGLFAECDEIETIPTNELFARDLVRRCKALAEMGEL